MTLGIKHKKGKRIAIAALLTVFSAAGVYAQSARQQIVATERNPTDNTLKSVTFAPDANLKMSNALDILRQQLGITDANISMRLKNVTNTKAGVATHRYSEYYKNIKVEFGEVTLSGKDGGVAFMTSNFYNPTYNPSTLPGISENAARAKALQTVGATKYKWEVPEEEAHIKARYHKNDTSYFPHGSLVWVEDRVINQGDRKLHLAYRFDIYAHEPVSRQDVYVDAITGQILLSNTRIKHATATGASRYSGTVPFMTNLVGGTYRLHDITRGSGVHTYNMNNGTSYGAATEITSATNTWPNVPANNIALDAHWGGEMVYDYWLSQQGRHSWDDLDGVLEQYVHYSNNYNNAYWDGAEMTYGDGSGIAAGGFTPLTSIDVTAHEIGHGVCEATAGLIYEKESGAMNEGFSDCWGATIENWSNPHEVDAMPKSPWEMGEEIGTEPLRSMNAPLLQGQPNTYGSTNWVNVTSCTPTGGNDYCGVHTNSGLLNYWYYLLVNGGSGTNGIGNAYVVNPLGWTKSAIILYQSELVLTSDATYADCRTASINAAITLYGACSPEVQCVTSAWYAVGVGPNYVPCVPQIGYTASVIHTSEHTTTTTCPASKTITFGIKPYGPVIAGGSPIVNIIVGSTTTAVAGVDYSLSATSTTFAPGDVSTHNITLTIYDNGAVNDSKHLDLALAVTPAGSGAEISPIWDSLFVFIDNDDSVPTAGGIIYPNLNTGINVTSDFTSPFYGKDRRARSQYLVYANEMAAAGVVPGAPISQLALNVLTKSSTAPFIAFSISMGNTAAPDLYSAFATGLTTVYTGDHTTVLGMDAIDFNSGTFTWDGTSNVVVQFCYGMNAATFAANDQVAGIQQGAYTIGDYNVTNSGSGTGCSLGFSTGNRAVVRPAMRFKQTVPPTKVATTVASTRVWNVTAGQNVYFYKPVDTSIIAEVNSTTHDLGCVTATVTQAGNGVVPAIFSAANRSRKEISIVPTINGSVANYDVTIYFTNTELAGIPPASLFLIKTDAPTDAAITASNTVLVTPTLVAGGSYVGFKTTFTGFSRYFLTDGPLCNPPAATITPAGPTSFCLGGNVLLNANTGAGLTYQWQLAGVDIPGATSSSYTATLGGAYKVKVSQFTCTATSSPVTVILDSAYAAPIGGFASVCVGQTIALTDATAGGVWSSSTPGVASVSSGTVSGVSAGTTTISYSTTNVCGTAVVTKVVTVSALPVVAGITGILSKCVSTTITLSDATPGGVWGSSNTGVASLSSGGVVSSTAIGTATVSYTVTNGFGCSSYATAVMEVIGAGAPIVTISANPNDTACAGESVTYTAIPTYGGTAPTYLWTENGTNVATGPTYTALLPHNGDVIVCTITSNYACLATSVSSSAPFVMRVLAPIVNTVSITATSTDVASGTMVTFVATAPYATSYQWYVSGTPVAGATTAVYSTNTLGNGQIVTCAVTSGNMCATPHVAISGGLTMHVTTGIYDSKLSGFSILPNPNKGTFTISGKIGATADDHVSITIINMLGQTVYSATSEAINGNVNAQISLNNTLANGMYVVKVASGEDNAVLHMILNK
jgi:Zn-dependent metalloprotease